MNVISYFPSLYPDEVLYSACARYKNHTNMKAQKTSMEVLFGNNHLTASVDFPSNINMLLQQIPRDVITYESLLQKHTLFPFYKPFLPLERVEKVRELMLDHRCTHNIPGTIGIMSYGISAPRNLRFCEECISEDSLIYGEMYWHREHQLTGVFHCDKHQKLLLETTINYSGKGRKHNLITLEEAINECKYIKSSRNYIVHNDLMLKISNLACELLRQNVSSLGLETIRSFYKAVLSKKGYITRKGNIRFKDLIIDFNNFFDEELLILLESSIQKETDTWFHKLLRKPRVTCHPIRHILLLLFLDADINLLLNIKKEIQPFGEGPWFCLNQAADHFHNPTIKDCRINYCTRSNLPIGIFSCSCGFTYSRKGPDKTWADKFKKDRVYSFGEVWISECKKIYINPDLSLREKSRSMGVDSKTLIKYATSNGAGSSAFETVQTQIELEKRTKRLLQTINNHQTPFRSVIRRENPRDYIWHYRNNRKWLHSILPKNSTRINKQRIDWLKTDNEILGPVRRAINDIFKYDGKPIRATRAEISRRVGNPNIIEYSLNKLPKTRKVISSFIESTEEYQIRRINWVFDNWKTDIELSMWRFKREAGINKESEFIKKYLKILFS